ERLLLPQVGDRRQVGDRLDLRQLLPLAALLEVELELHRRVEVVLDGPLAPPRHDADPVEPGGDGLLDDVLDHRLVDQGQHLLRLGLGGRQEAGAEAGGREDGGAHTHAADSFRGPGSGPAGAATRTSSIGRGPRISWAANVSMMRRRASSSSGNRSRARTRAWSRSTASDSRSRSTPSAIGGSSTAAGWA